MLTGAAANARNSTAKPVGSGTGARLDEVLVTAQRRRERVQKVPIGNLLSRIGETDLPSTRRYAVNQSRAPPASG